MATRLVSVNIGLPRDINWRGKTIRTGVWKSPVVGRVIVRKLNIDGDGQGDLAGHGGVNRAVMVYQLDSYRYWERQLSRLDFSYGQFGENFTVEGLPDVGSQACTSGRFERQVLRKDRSSYRGCQGQRTAAKRDSNRQFCPR
jgi:MOSC domain-containing protein YiiM